jgi:hypothetical protein
VRSTLKYGVEVWTADLQQLEKLEQVQTRAGIKILALNKKDHRCAIRALMRVPPLKDRFLRGRFRYNVKHRLARRIIETEP